MEAGLNEEMAARLWSELGEIRANTKTAVAGVESLHADMSSVRNRVAKLEGFKQRIMGMVAVVSLIGTLAWNWVENRMHR